MKIALISAFALLVNIPMGMWRYHLRKFSAKWFIAIHAPVPLVILLRVLLNVSISFIAIFIAFSILGQIAGGKLETARKNTPAAG